MAKTGTGLGRSLSGQVGVSRCAQCPNPPPQFTDTACLFPPDCHPCTDLGLVIGNALEAIGRGHAAILSPSSE
jgi:hypothetical protein